MGKVDIIVYFCLSGIALASDVLSIVERRSRMLLSREKLGGVLKELGGIENICGCTMEVYM